MFIHRFDCYWLIIDVSGGFSSSHFLKDNVDFIFVFYFFCLILKKKIVYLLRVAGPLPRSMEN